MVTLRGSPALQILVVSFSHVSFFATLSILKQPVVWKSAVESLEASQKYLKTSEDARAFVEKYMGPIISILVEQQPSKIGPHERTCVQDSLALAVVIVALDLDIQLKRKGECKVPGTFL